MTKNAGFAWVLFGATAITMLKGCATPSEVRSLAEQTAASTAALSVATGETAQASQRIAERRAANIARLHGETGAVQARVEFDKTLMTKIGETAMLDLFKELQAWSETVKENDAQATVDQAAFAKKILESRTELDGKSKSLSEVAGILAALAEEEKTSTHALFFGKFVKAVLDDVKEQRDKGKQSSQQAEEKLNDQQSDADDG